MENNLAKQKSKAPKQAKGKLKSIVKVVPSAQGKAKHVSYQLAASAPPASQRLVTQPAQPMQTAFADAMARWKLNMVAAINSCLSPTGFQTDQAVPVSLSTKTQVQNIQQVALENQLRGDPTQMVIYSQPAVVAFGDADSRSGSRFVDQAADDDQQMVSPDHADMDYETAPSDMELDPEDNPLPPPLGRPGDGPVAAATAPQGASNQYCQNMCQIT